MSECTPVAIYNHILFEVVDNNGNIIKENDPNFAYWSGKDGNIKCPKYEYESHSTAIEYWICAGILIPLRLFISYMHLRIAAHIIRKRRGDSRAGNNNQPKTNSARDRHKICFGVPLTTAFELFHTIVVVTAAIAYGLYETMSPIEAHILLSLCASTFIISFIFSTMKIIHLGQRLLPVSLRGDKIVMNNKIQGDKILLFLFSSMVLCEILAPIFSLIVATATRDTKMSIYSLVFHGIAVQMGIFILVRQGTRLISYMMESNASRPVNKIENNTTKAINPPGAKSKAEEVDQVNRLIHRMRVRTIAAFFCGTPPALILILGGVGVFPMYWYFLYLLAYGISLASLASTFMFLPRGMSLFCCLCRRNSDRNQDQSSEKNDTTKNKTLSNSRQSKLVPGVVSVPNTFAGDQLQHYSLHFQSQAPSVSNVENTQTE